MALIVNSNPAAKNAMTNVNRTTRGLQHSFAKISSGLRITKAADDAAGMAMAENLDSESRSLRQAQRNTHDGISVIQTAEGATNEVGDIIKRMRELAVQSSSETLANTERAYIQDEFSELAEEVDRIANVTEFNGIALGNAAGTMNVQVGANNTGNDQIAISIGDLKATTLKVDGGNISMSTAASAQAALSTLDTAMSSVNQIRSNYGSVQNRLESALNNLETYNENISSAESNIRDADFAHETAELSKFQIMQQAGVAILGQASAMNSGALRLIG
jgi:flagellin